MELISDSSIYRPLAEAAIKRYGTSGDHHIEWWEHTPETATGQPIFAGWPDGSGILAHREPDFWTVWSNPLMPIELTGQRTAELCRTALSDPKIKNVWLMDVVPEVRKGLIAESGKDLKVRKIYYTLHWPVHEMDAFDEALPGGEFKEIRNARAKFYREHNVQIVPAQNVPTDQLAAVVTRWIDKRVHHDRAYPRHYLKFIENKFSGAISARAMVVNGQPVGFNVGWMVPNSDIYYGGIGLHDYSHRDLGLVLYLEDLEWIKSHGYKKTDQAGSEKGGPLNFKLRFKPQSLYKTYTFSVARK